MSDSFFCLDIGDTYIKVVDATQFNNLWSLSAIGFAENLPQFFSVNIEKNIDEEANRIKQLVDSCKITKKNVHCIIPDAYTYSQILEMPRLNEKEMISAIRYQADQFIPMPIDETNIDIEVLQDIEQTKKMLILMVAAPKAIIDRVQSSIELAGLIPASLENSLSATARFLSTSAKSIGLSDSPILFVNAEINTTSLYIFDTAKGVLLQNHTFPIGLNLFLKELQINVNLDQRKISDLLQTFSLNQSSSIPIENIISPLLQEYNAEIKKFIASTAEKTQTNVKKIIFINDSLRFNALPQFVEKSTALPAQFIDIAPILNKNELEQRFAKSLSLFVSVLGGITR